MKTQAVAKPDSEASLLAQIAALQQEVADLREGLSLRDAAMDATETHFNISKHVEPESIIVYCNRALAEHHGYAREELVGQSVRRIAPRDWDPERYQQVRKKLEAGETIKFEAEVPRRDGSTFWAGMTILPLHRGKDGKLTHTMSIAADITAKRAAARRQQDLQDELLGEMKKRERILLELRLAQKLESVGRLAAGVAHEINTPIQYVADSLYFLRSSFDDLFRMLDMCSSALDEQPATPEVAQLKQHFLDASKTLDLEFLLTEVPKAFERTFDGVDRVSKIVRAMKEFSHPDATEFSSADINHALQNTLTVATNEYKYVAQVRTELAEELPLVICNIGELNQVFLNLIVNAAHAIQDAGRDISTGEIRVATAVAGDSVEITIADNGCGIPKENLEKIYDPFFTTKEVGRGTGQGLAITHSIVVDKHGGTVQVYSEPGAGTQFIISLPIAGRPVKEAL
jgi:PAS domain S-box-containing protein